MNNMEYLQADIGGRDNGVGRSDFYICLYAGMPQPCYAARARAGGPGQSRE
jgi:hypothetical protein